MDLGSCTSGTLLFAAELLELLVGMIEPFMDLSTHALPSPKDSHPLSFPTLGITPHAASRFYDLFC
jgi:hypothetical protein